MDGALAVGVTLDERVMTGLSRYLSVLLLWNRRINLTAVREPEGIVDLCFVDSLAIVPHIVASVRTLIDVGSGAGFPGAVMALARPDIAVTLVESNHKKTAFLEAVRREIPLPNLVVKSVRIESLSPPHADVATSRATWDLAEWLAFGATLVRPGGMVLGMEGAEEHALPAGAERHPYPSARAAGRSSHMFHVKRRRAWSPRGHPCCPRLVPSGSYGRFARRSTRNRCRRRIANRHHSQVTRSSAVSITKRRHTESIRSVPVPLETLHPQGPWPRP